MVCSLPEEVSEVAQVARHRTQVDVVSAAVKDVGENVIGRIVAIVTGANGEGLVDVAPWHIGLAGVGVDLVAGDAASVVITRATGEWIAPASEQALDEFT